jgi:hypothetical protein
MKKILLSLLGAATMAMSANAMALDTTLQYNAFVDRGVIPLPAGAVFFQFDYDDGLPGCQYVGEWLSPFPSPISAQCVIRESKTTANFSCLENSVVPVPGVIVNETVNLPQPPPIPPCSGFDYFGQYRVIATLVLGEDLTNILSGIVQFDGPLGFVYGASLVGA